MRVDPVTVVYDYCQTLPEPIASAVTGDLTSRSAGDTTIYLYHSGGFRLVRDRMDRADIEYEVYHQERYQAASLAYLVREYLLESLPGLMVGDVQVLDVGEVRSPVYLPDDTSREHAYNGEVSVFFHD